MLILGVFKARLEEKAEFVKQLKAFWMKRGAYSNPVVLGAGDEPMDSLGSTKISLYDLFHKVIAQSKGQRKVCATSVLLHPLFVS